MALLILYATKSGASEQCAFLLAEYIPGSTLCNLESEKPTLRTMTTSFWGLVYATASSTSQSAISSKKQTRPAGQADGLLYLQ